MLNRDRGNNDLASLLPHFCFNLFADGRRDCTLLVEATCLLYDIIVLFDDIIDDEINVPWWSDRYEAATTIQSTRGTIANTITVFTALLCKKLASMAAVTGCSTTTAEKIQSAFLDSLQDTAVGQQMSLVVNEPTLEASWEIARLKSGTFFALACWSGAYLATEDWEQAEPLLDFGKELGILVQLSDDLSDLWSHEEGESDISGVSWSLPIAYGMQVLPEAQQQHLKLLLAEAGKGSKAAEEDARALLIKSGAVVYLRVELEKHYRLAKSILVQHAPAGPAQTGLLGIIDKVKEIFPS